MKTLTVVQLYVGDTDNGKALWMDTVWHPRNIEQARKTFPQLVYRKVRASFEDTCIEPSFSATSQSCELEERWVK